MNWMQTPSGGRAVLDEENGVDLSEVTLADLAEMLAKVNRFCGATKAPRSVAAHSVYCADIAWRAGYGPRLQMAALMHDAHEAFCSDIPSPFMHFLGFEVESEIRLAQRRIDLAFERRFCRLDLTAAERNIVSTIDTVALVTEARDLLRGGPRDNWIDAFPVFPSPEPIFPSLHWSVDAGLFVQRFTELSAYAELRMPHDSALVAR